MELHHNVIIGIIIVIYILFVIGYTTGKNNEFFNIVTTNPDMTFLNYIILTVNFTKVIKKCKEHI